MDLFKVTGDRFALSVPLMKYDERTGEFEGYLAVDEIDKVKEQIDLVKSLPFFEEWQGGFAKATDGASYGNVREQHDPKKAAGKLLAPLEQTTTADGKAAWKVRGLAVDPITKQKLADRVLVALSIGGEYTEKSKADENGVVRYVAKPNEVSLVDNPCMPSAMITVVKADGSQTISKAVGFQPEQGWKCRAGWEHGHARKEEAKACDGSTPVAKSAEEHGKDELRKSLYTVSCLVDIIYRLQNEADNLDMESQYEGDPDDAALSDRVDAVANTLFDLASDVLAEEKADANQSDPQTQSSGAAPSGGTTSTYSQQASSVAGIATAARTATPANTASGSTAAIAASQSFATSNYLDSNGNVQPVDSTLRMAALAESLKKSTPEKLKSVLKSLYVPSGNGSSNATLIPTQEVTMSDKKDEKTKEPEPVAKTDEGALAKVESVIAKGFADLTKTFNERFEKQDARFAAVEKSISETRDKAEKQTDALAATVAKMFAAVTKVTVDDDSDLEKVIKAISEKPAAPKAALRAVSKAEDSKPEDREVKKAADRSPEQILMEDAIPVAQLPAA